MKKTFIILSAFILSLVIPKAIHAQTTISCAETLNTFFGGGFTNETPVVLNKLGTSPQFGEIAKHTADGAYTHLKKVYARNRGGSAAEIDRYLIALGYTGFKDPAFNASRITPEILSAGTTGWMGAYAKGHKYKWSRLGRDFETFKVQAKNSPCFAYIMKKCGNAFYQPADCSAPNPCPECIKGQAFTANPFCPCTPCPVECVTQTISVSGSGEIASGDIVKSTVELPVVASFGGKKLCVGNYSFPVSATYEYKATGSTSTSKTIEVCDQGQGALKNMDINLPIALSFNLADSQLALGDNGVVNANISSAKRFKALSKIYKTCPADMAATTTTSALQAPVVESMSASSTMSSSPAESVNGQDCKKQTLFFTGAEAVSEVNSKAFTNNIIIIGHTVKTGKLQKGEVADKYLCLGNYSVPGNTSLAYTVKGESNLNKVVEICDKAGNAKAEENVEMPLDLKFNFTNQNMMVGDGGRVVMQLTESQFKKLAKRFSRCCADGSATCR